MKTNKELLKIAQKYIGQGGAKFRKYCGLPSGAAWCNAFVTYIFHEGDDAKLYCDGKKMTYCPTSIKWCQKNLAQVPLYLAMPMDVIYFDWDRNGVPNHIGFVREHESTSVIKTIEGNTSNKVMYKSRPSKYVCGIFRPHYKATFDITKELKIDGSCGYNTIAMLQKALGGCTVDGVLGKTTVKRLQHFLAITEDGCWGNGTSKALQKMLKANGFYKGDIDGAFGKQSVIAIQKWCNARVFPKKDGTGEIVTPEKPKIPTKAEKILDAIDQYAWAYGTPSKKWKYDGGSPRSAYKLALQKYMKKKAKISQSDCGYFVSTVVRATGIDPKFLALRKASQSFPKSDKFNRVLHGKKIPSGFLKAGDIIRYKKKGSQHTLFYIGNGRVAEAGRKHYFPHIHKDTHKYNASNVKIKTLEVLRVKP